MERVAGVGGLFFRARDPGALAKWYLENLGVGTPPGAAEGHPWLQEAGMTVFAPFEETSDYFPAERRWMINFRVRDLEALLTQLRAAGVEISRREDHSYGRFARIHDPEGNPIELWEPLEPPAPAADG